MSNHATVVSTQDEINPATGQPETVVVSLVGSTIRNFLGVDWTEYDTPDEAEADFLAIVRSGVHATGEMSRECLARHGVENPPWKTWIKE